MIGRPRTRSWRWASALLTTAAAGCSDAAEPERLKLDINCSISSQFIIDGGPGKDGIPALTNSALARADDSTNGYLLDDDRVIGIRIGNDAIAVPLNIGWWHEIVNLDYADKQLAITHCPLTGSSLVFDRGAAENARFGVSGLLYFNNLIMYDRTEPLSLWPQMMRGARCGRRDGAKLEMVAAIEMTWAGWRELYPTTWVVSSATGHSRNYRDYPYGNYGELFNNFLVFPIPMPPLDHRRPLKERVLGSPSGEEGGMAIPFGALETRGSVAAVSLMIGSEEVVVLWDRAKWAAMAYRPNVGDTVLEFERRGDVIIDLQTESIWQVDGLALSGPLAGTRLLPISEAFVAYWFAWAAFYPETELWTGA